MFCSRPAPDSADLPTLEQHLGVHSHPALTASIFARADSGDTAKSALWPNSGAFRGLPKLGGFQLFWQGPTGRQISTWTTINHLQLVVSKRNKTLTHSRAAIFGKSGSLALALPPPAATFGERSVKHKDTDEYLSTSLPPPPSTLSQTQNCTWALCRGFSPHLSRVSSFSIPQMDQGRQPNSIPLAGRASTNKTTPPGQPA